MKLTHEEWRIQRAHLAEAIATSSKADHRTLLEKAFRRAIAWLDEHPAALVPIPVRVEVRAKERS